MQFCRSFVRFQRFPAVLVWVLFIILIRIGSGLISEHAVIFQRKFSTGRSFGKQKFAFASYESRSLTSTDHSDEDEIIEFPEHEDVLDADDNDDDEDNCVGMASPLPQWPSEDEARKIFPNTDQWIDSATEDLFNTDMFPLGTLSEDDVESITGLMAALVRRRSVEGALTVERLLKRVVDDMRANNNDIRVTTRMYTIAIDAWAKSGAAGSAQRAQHIHDAMVEMYEETKDPAIEPSSISYNTLINAHGKSPDANNLENAEKVLQEMINSNAEYAKPDAISFSTLMDAYVRSNNPNAAKRAEDFFELMDQIKVKKNVYTFAALQNVYARSGLPDAPQRVENVLYRMQDLYEGGDHFAKPTCVNYNAWLTALSRSPNRTSAAKAAEILHKMELPVEAGGFDVEPDRLSYALAILTCSRCKDDVSAASKAEKLLEKMEARAKEDEQKRQAVSSVAPPNVRLDVESFNVVLTALSKSRAPDAVERIVAIIKRMEQYTQNGQTQVRPTVRSWNAFLNALSRSGARDSCQQAEQVLSHMFELHASGVPHVKPDAFSFAAVLGAYQKSSDPHAVERADAILRRMELLYEEGELDAPPDVYHYTIVCAAWARSSQSIAPNRAMQILSHMTQLDAQGYPGVRPNVRTYNAVLDCLSRGKAEEEAERLLDHMLMLDQQGEHCVDAFSFNSVMAVFCRSKKPGTGKRAETVLERFLDYSEGNPRCRPDTRSFTQIIEHYRRSDEPDAPYRAEYLLNRMISLFKSGHNQLEPSSFAFKSVMDAYSNARHPDSGSTAERLLRQMKDLNKKYGASNLVVDSSIIYSVLFAWSVSGDDDAGRRAELYLDDMERKYEAGNDSQKPVTRSYGHVLNAWTKSSSFDKAKRSLGILKRMEEQYRKGNKDVRPNEHAHSLVINACAFTNSGIEAETEAFHIAVSTFDKMLASEDYQPSSLTYGWFIQACGRLRVAENLKNEQIQRAWNLCCQKGLVNGFVLHRFTGAAPEPLYHKLMAPILSRLPQNHESKERLKFRISPKDLPPDWTRNNSAINKDGDSGNSGWWGKSY